MSFPMTDLEFQKMDKILPSILQQPASPTSPISPISPDPVVQEAKGKKEKETRRRYTSPWSEAEQSRLKEAVQLYANQKKRWHLISVHVGTRTSSQCFDRYVNWMNKGPREWSIGEKTALVNGLKLHGTQWCVLARMIPTRTQGDIKNRYNSALRSVKRRLARDKGELRDKGPANNETRLEKDKDILLQYCMELQTNPIQPFTEAKKQKKCKRVQENESFSAKIAKHTRFLEKNVADYGLDILATIVLQSLDSKCKQENQLGWIDLTDEDGLTFDAIEKNHEVRANDGVVDLLPELLPPLELVKDDSDDDDIPLNRLHFKLKKV